jgi:exosome complex component RRP4
MKRIVLPGEMVTAERKRLGEHVFDQNGKIFSDVLGIASVDNVVASVVPLRGRYLPRMNDLIVGIVAQEVHSGYLVDINSFYLAFVYQKELRDPLQVGSIVSAKVMNVSETNDVELGFVRVFYGGEIMQVSPVKVPRMIGKNGSMLEVLKNGTQANVMIGRNGLVWSKGGNVDLLRLALHKIEEEAHFEHLTESVKVFLEQNQKINA